MNEYEAMKEENWLPLSITIGWAEQSPFSIRGPIELVSQPQPILGGRKNRPILPLQLQLGWTSRDGNGQLLKGSAQQG